MARGRRRSVHHEPGERFGDWIVVEEAPARGSRRLWRCRCDHCGLEREIDQGSLRSGRTKGCGRTHGGTAGDRYRHPLYATWQSMRQRCRDPNAESYPHYGGRGISVCERWGDFAAFVEDMGEKPGGGYSLDRIDVDGDYKPENVRWATAKEQMANRRDSS